MIKESISNVFQTMIMAVILSMIILWLFYGDIRASIILGTSIPISICVVFLPLAMLSGMSGQLFKQLGYTIVFCMVASLFSAVSIVPLCYYQWHPMENDGAPVSGLIKSMQNWYRTHMPSIIPKTKLVMGVSLLLLAFSLFLATRLDLMSSVDEGIVQMTVKTKPGLSIEAVDDILSGLEEMVMEEEDVDHYLVTYGSSGLSVGGGSDQIEIDLQSTDYDSLKAAANALAQLSTAI